MAFPVAVAQVQVEPGEVDENRLAMIHHAEWAISRGAQLVVFPEACISDIFRGAQAFAETIPGPTTEIAASIAQDSALAIPLLERSPDGKIYSSCALVTREGVQGIARKCHLFHDANGHDLFRDDDVVAPAGELTIFDLGDIRVGVLLGFDAEFPEAFRTHALRGADLIIAPLNCIEPDLPFLTAMASHNRIPLAIANRIGFRKIYPGMPELSAVSLPILQDKERNFVARCKGGSVILDERGRIMAQPQGQTPGEDASRIALEAPVGAVVQPSHFQHEEVLSASFRIEELRVQRITSPFFSQRRKALYSDD